MDSLNPEKVCFIVMKAREFDVKEDTVEEYPGSSDIDDDFRSILSDYPDDPILEELQSFINAMNEDEQAELIALTLLGRGDYLLVEWPEALSDAHNRRSVFSSEYLLGIPLLSDFLEEGLATMGQSCASYEFDHL